MNATYRVEVWRHDDVVGGPQNGVVPTEVETTFQQGDAPKGVAVGGDVCIAGVVAVEKYVVFVEETCAVAVSEIVVVENDIVVFVCCILGQVSIVEQTTKLQDICWFLHTITCVQVVVCVVGLIIIITHHELFNTLGLVYHIWGIFDGTFILAIILLS